METSYGFKHVGAGDKQSLVNDVFHKVANRYDLMNDLMSAGLHRLWKDAMVAGSIRRNGRAGAFSTLPAAPATSPSASSRRATVMPMPRFSISTARCFRRRPDRAEKKGLSEIPISSRPMPRNCLSLTPFDAYTIAFGIRNVPRIDVALSEAYRVLKPGGRFVCLEFSEVDMPLLDKAYEAWSFSAIPKIGKAVTGDGEPYSYLVESIRKFPNQQTFAAMISGAGFDRATFRNYSGGIAALHSGWKL